MNYEESKRDRVRESLLGAAWGIDFHKRKGGTWGGAYWEFLQEMRKVNERDRPGLYRLLAVSVKLYLKKKVA